jgi:cobalt-zinc-cadmium resistance protein CzcA
MIHAIIDWSLRNRLIVILGTIALIAIGIHSALHLNVEAYPDPTPPLVEIISQNPGASPEEMERLVGIPLETVLNGLPGLEDLRSTSISGLNDIKCQFAYGTDYYQARQEVINRLGSVSNLPAGVTPRLSPWSPTGEIVRYVLEGPGYSLTELKAVQDWVITRHLKQVPGVADVTGFGGMVKQYQIMVDPALLRQFDITLKDVEDAIDRSNANVGANQISLGSQVHNVRAIGLLGGGVDPLANENIPEASRITLQKLDDINNVVITTRDGVPIFVKQVAHAVVSHQPRLGKVGRGDEDDVVQGIVLMRKYEKSLPTAEGVQRKIDELNSSGILPPGMKIVPFNRRTDLVHVTTHNVLHNLSVGMGLVAAVLLVFLGNLTSGLIVAAMIPLSLLFAITVLAQRGESANLLSIGAVDFGIIVDSAVIIVENIYRHVAGHHADRSLSLNGRILAASGEVERPMIFSRAIILCAFIPLFVMSGPEGALFGPMARVYAYSILGALILSITLAPVLCSLFFNDRMVERLTPLDRLLRFCFLGLLDRCLLHRRLFLAGVGVLLAATAVIIPSLGGEFMPPLEEGNLWIRATLPRTVSLDEASRLAPKLREVIAAVPEVRGVMSQIGRPDDGTDVTGFYNLEFNVPLKPMETWRVVGGKRIHREDIERELSTQFQNFAGISFSFSQLIRDNVEEALSGVKGANSVKIYGSDLHTLDRLAHQVAEQLRQVPGTENVAIFPIIGQPNLEIRIDRARCARYGVNVAEVESIIQVAVGGQAFSEMVEGEKLFDIVLRLPPQMRDDPSDIARIPIELRGDDGEPRGRVLLADLAEINPHAVGAATIYRENNRRYIPIKFEINGRDLASTIADARERVRQHVERASDFPQGYELEWAGEFAQMQEAFGRLLWMVPLSLIGIILLLYIAFKNFKDALLIMANVLVAIMGGIWALKLTETPFSISAAVGFISIFGIAVQSGVLLISNFNQLQDQGLPVRQAILQGAELRLRPVVMTSLTAIFGLLPAALADSIGSQAQRPLALVIVGGMLVVLLLSQYLMPVLYSFFPTSAHRKV